MEMRGLRAVTSLFTMEAWTLTCGSLRSWVSRFTVIACRRVLFIEMKQWICAHSSTQNLPFIIIIIISVVPNIGLVVSYSVLRFV